jgi:uncharacterized protein YkwD
MSLGAGARLRLRAFVTAPRLVAVALIATVAASLVATRGGDIFSDPVPATLGRNSKCWKKKGSERAFVKKMNKTRKRSGRGKVRFDPELAKVARVHTRDMTRRNTLYHTSQAQLRRRVRGWTLLGENVGVGNTVGSLHRAFMNSPAHRANILHGSFRYSGVGVRKRRGRMWVTVIFEARRNPGTRLRMSRC